MTVFTNTIEAQKAIDCRQKDTAISLVIERANEEPNSICTIALAWLGTNDIGTITYRVKPPGDVFTSSRRITAKTVQDSPAFDTVWTYDILPLLKGDILAMYNAEEELGYIRASYEAYGKAFTFPDVYIRDLHFLATTYMPDLGNDSFISIIHQLGITADIDDATSRAIACCQALEAIRTLYPASGYGVPVGTVLEGALRVHIPTFGDTLEAEEPQDDQEYTLGERLAHATRFSLVPVLVLTLTLGGYFLYKQQKATAQHVDFSRYATTDVSRLDTPTYPTFDTSKTYVMMRTSYIIRKEEDISLFVAASESRDMEQIRSMINSDKVILVGSNTKVSARSQADGNGYVKIQVLSGPYKGQEGYAAYTMLNP